MKLIKKSLIILSFFAIILVSGCQLKGRNDFDPETAALARMKLGLGYLAHADESEENIKLAHYNLRAAAEYSPNNPQIMLAMAMFDQHVGEYQEAEMIYKRIVMMEPGNGLYHIHYGAFLCARERYPEAKTQFQQSIDLDKHRWKADGFEQYGYCAVQNDDKETADLMFKQLFQYDINRRESVKKTAELYQKTGDVKIADYLFSIIKK